MKVITKAIFVTAVLMTSACAIHAGNPQTVKTTTQGQELVDLHKALTSGAISEAEYRELRAAVIAEGNPHKCDHEDKRHHNH